METDGQKERKKGILNSLIVHATIAALNRL